MKKKCLAYVLIILTLTAGAFIMAACDGGDADENPVKTSYGKNETASVESIEIKFTVVKTSSGDGFFMAPDEGNIFVGVQFSVKNNQADEYALSSIFCFSAKMNGADLDYAWFGVGLFGNSLDGTIAAGQTLTGWYAVELTENWSGELSINFRPELLSSASVDFVVKLSDVTATVPGDNTDPVKVTLSFDTNGGSAIPSVAYDKDAIASIPQLIPTKAEYTFLAWYYDGALTEMAPMAWQITKDTTLYAKWLARFTLAFNTNGGSIQPSVTDDEGTLVGEPLMDPTKSGFTFEGWYTDVALTAAAVFPIQLMQNITVYAKWAVVPKYTLTFNTNGGSIQPSVTDDEGTLVGEPLMDPTKSGFTFEGWYADVALTAAAVFPIQLTQNITVYAKWAAIPRVTLTFNSNGGSEIPSVTYDEGDFASIPLTFPTRRGYSFDDWYLDAAFTNAAPYFWTINQDTTLYAKWTALTSYTVRFETNGGSVIPSEIYYIGESVTAPIPPTRAGYRFDGWFFDEELIVPVSFPWFASNRTLYAKWTASCIVIFNTNGGSVIPSGTYYIGDSVAAPISPTRAGYRFDGWFFDEDLTVSVSFPWLASNRTLYAKWTALFTATFSTNGGSGVSSVSGIGILVERPPNPTKDGSVFLGWYTDPGLTTSVAFPFTLTQNLTLYAKWVRLSAINAGRSYNLALDEDGWLCVWGENRGQLGDGTTTDRNAPVSVKQSVEFEQISAGNEHSLALDKDGNLWAWGYNYWWLVGDDTRINRETPVQIAQGTTFNAISAGYNHSLAIDADGNIWAWGFNTYGQLGDGTTDRKNTPVQITQGTEFIKVAAGMYFSLAIDKAGNVWAWGDNAYGQLGDGTTDRRNAPVQITQGKEFKQVSAGSDHSLALEKGGNVWAWGRNTSGQIGDGSTTHRSAPVQITQGTEFKEIVAGGTHNLAIDADGNLWAWGAGGSGQLGDGATAQRNTPTAVMQGTKIMQISAGGYHSIVMDTNSNVWVFGLNNLGQLGDGTTTNRPAPFRL
ncbi:MAG: InlB B-repeat-containing protein [Firmicutes bacterium]|nr:InlB B-repeat-containing protein [Bacillota bacterium]